MATTQPIVLEMISRANGFHVEQGRYLTTRQVAEATELRTHQLQWLADNHYFPVRVIGRPGKPGRHRQWNASDIPSLKALKLLRDKGISTRRALDVIKKAAHRLAGDARYLIVDDRGVLAAPDDLDLADLMARHKRPAVVVRVG